MEEKKLELRSSCSSGDLRLSGLRELVGEWLGDRGAQAIERAYIRSQQNLIS